MKLYGEVLATEWRCSVTLVFSALTCKRYVVEILHCLVAAAPIRPTQLMEGIQLCSQSPTRGRRAGHSSMCAAHACSQCASHGGKQHTLSAKGGWHEHKANKPTPRLQWQSILDQPTSMTSRIGWGRSTSCAYLQNKHHARYRNHAIPTRYAPLA